MAGMNRLSPLIARRVGPMAAAGSFDRPEPSESVDAGRWLDDLRQFAVGWLGGLVFFGTFIA